ncbi:putative reverse transcriptase domain-containing protein [Tanacetum coccineum]
MMSRSRTRVFVQAPFRGCDILVSRATVIENQVMAAPFISILSDSSEESVGSHAPRVILFGSIPTSIPVIPVVPAKVPIAPVDLIVAPKVGAVSVISSTRVLDLVDCSSSSDSDPSEDSFPVAPELPLVSPFLCSDDSEADSESEPAEQRPKRHESLTPSSEFPLAPIVAPPKIRRRPAILVRLGEAIPFGRPYRTHSNGPLHLRTLHQIFLHVHLQIHYQTHHEFIHHRYAPLSTLYPPTTSESSPDSSSERSLDSSSPSVGPSRNRCISPATLVPLSTLVSRSIAPALVDLPPRKSFRDSYSSEGVGAHTEDGIDLGVEVATIDIREDEEEFSLRQRGITVRRDRVDSLHRHMALSQEEFCQVRRDRDDTRRRLGRLESLVERRLGIRQEALAAYEATSAANALEAESQSQNGSDGDNGNGGNGNPKENDRGARLLMKLVVEVYCPRTKIQKMKYKLWNLTAKNNDLAAYTQRFQELTMLCTKMVPGEEDRVEKFIGGLPDNIQGNVIAAEPTRLQDTIRIANNLMDQKLKGYAMKNAENKRKRQGHYRNDFPKLKDQNRGNKTGNKNGIGEAKGKSYVLGEGDANRDSNAVTGTFLLNNHYASVLFDLGADRSFVSILDIIPDTLDINILNFSDHYFLLLYVTFESGSLPGS